MTASELAQLIANGNCVSFAISLPAIYAVLLNKFDPPGYDKSSDVCMNLRGSLAVEIAECCRPFVDKSLVTVTAILGVDERPLERKAPLDGEAFTAAFQDYLHGDSNHLQRYWRAYIHKRRLDLLWRVARLVVPTWAILAFLGSGAFTAWANSLLCPPSSDWLLFLGVLTAIPPLFFLVCLFVYGGMANHIAGMGEDSP